MPNVLTGDFDAVVQVSGGTINRLLAGMHQNAFTDSDRPSFPHSASFRIGDDGPIRGHRGWVQAQLGVPLVEALRASTDRFRLEVGVRARYRADPGSRALPEYINGAVTAEFQVVDIDPSCFGWRGRAEDYVWVRVVRGSVGFAGTAVDDRDLISVIIDVEDPADVNARIARLVETLLMTRFEANPHKVGREFRRSWMRSLNDGGESCVAIPVGVDGPPVGSLSSLDQIVLGGRDVAVAMSSVAIEARINGALQERVGFITTLRFFFQWTIGDDDVLGIDLSVDVVTIDITWNVYLNNAWVDWNGSFIVGIGGGGPMSVLTLHLTGMADTSDNDYDITFSATQTLAMHFDEAGQQLVVQAVGAPTVTVDNHGRFAGIIKARAPDLVKSRLSGMFQTQYIPVASAMAPLAEQLIKFDPGAGVRLDAAEFGFDGVVLRGRVWMSPRANPTVRFVTTPEGDGFSALEAWIPGGRIDRFEWTWAFTDGKTGNAKRDDRWLLRRPSSKQGRFGMSLAGRSPLPGLDGNGKLCLRLTGVRVETATGALVPITSTMQCDRYGMWFAVTVEDGLGRPHLRDVPELTTDVPFPQLALRDAGLPAGAAGSNTLVLHVGSDFDAETSMALFEGLAQVKRRDAGLALLVLYGDGSLGTDRAREALADLAPRLRRLGTTATVNEDVDGSWAAALGVDDRDATAWRLLSPRGGVTWTHDGRADAETLALALGECLLPSGPAIIAVIDPWSPGISVDDIYGAAFGDLIDTRSKCPPPALRRRLESGVAVSFVRAGSAASLETLRGLAAETEASEYPPWTMVVVDGADQEATDALAHQLGLDLPLLADPTGRVSARLGIRVWPTTVHLGSSRSEAHVLSDAGPRRPPERAEAT